MRIHILGVCGTFMGGVAALARASGHQVTGCDANVYPPMNSQLAALGINLIEGYGADQAMLNPDVFVIGNVVSRGNPLVEEILKLGLPYTSGPHWLAEHVLAGKWVLAVAGTHGKTTTAALLAWILEAAGLNPGFLIGGVPENFGVSARETASPFFVIEADEYDTAFFDKRSKFIHYRARTTILNNLEYDHADIFPDLAAIETQFHHWVRTLSGDGLIVANGADANLVRVLEQGCWTPVEHFAVDTGWQAGPPSAEGRFAVNLNGAPQGVVKWDLLGRHNQLNALAALAAARHAGVPVAQGITALAGFKNVKRRLEVRGTVHGITVYDDFAHHPTAIRETIAALRSKVHGARILAVLEPRSNSMRLGVMKDSLALSLADAQHVFCYTGGIGWDVQAALTPLGMHAEGYADLEALIAAVARAACVGDHVLVMSNGGFGGIHDKLLTRL